MQAVKELCGQRYNWKVLNKRLEWRGGVGEYEERGMR